VVSPTDCSLLLVLQGCTTDIRLSVRQRAILALDRLRVFWGSALQTAGIEQRARVAAALTISAQHAGDACGLPFEQPISMLERAGSDNTGYNSALH
jgi:hypothetical protein